jgi:tetratricopeptide (TPR) repeat protein
MHRLLIGLLTAISAAAQSPQEMAKNLNNEANRVADLGNYAEAERLYQQSIDIWRSLGPGFEAHTAGTLVNLAVALSGEGRRPAATRLFQEALALHLRALGPRHLRTITNMNELATNYLMTGDPDRGEALYREVLPIERELYPHDLQLAHTLEGLAYDFVRRKVGQEALPLAEEALRIAIERTGENSLEAALAYSTVAESYRIMSAGERALPLYRKARVLYEKALGPDHPRVASLLSQEGLILMHDGKFALADQAMTQAVKSLKKTCPDCQAELAITQSNLGLLRLRQKRYRDADEAFSAVIELREKVNASTAPELADALQNLAAVREKEHLLDDAARLNSRAQMIRAYR